ITGALDTKFTAIARHMAQVLPQSQLRIIAGAGHTVHLEQPQEFASLVTNFIRLVGVGTLASPSRSHLTQPPYKTNNHKKEHPHVKHVNNMEQSPRLHRHYF
ncbi:MAG TPA: hypothetical protein VIY29_00515, partial [Ktedonobacteraceae bacterium]